MVHPEIRLAYVNALSDAQKYHEQISIFVRAFLTKYRVLSNDHTWTRGITAEEEMLAENIIQDLISEPEFGRIMYQYTGNRKLVESFKDVVS